MNKEIEDYLKIRKQPISTCKELSKFLVGRRKTPVLLTENFRLDFENQMYKLAILEEKIQNAINYIGKFIPIDNDTILMSERQRDYLLEILEGGNK